MPGAAVVGEALRLAEPHTEDGPVDLTAAGDRRITIGAVVELERFVVHAQTIDGLVLRYGYLCGPGPGVDAPRRPPGVQVEAAAWAAVLAIDRGNPGRPHVVDDDRTVSNARARRELGWDPQLRTKAGTTDRGQTLSHGGPS